MRAAWIILALTLVWTPAVAAAQTGSVRGVVRDGDDRPIPAATVMLARAAGFAPLDIATDERGAFVVDGLAPGRYEVSVSLQGFGKETRAVVVDSGARVELTIVLQPTYTETVIVTANRSEQTLLSTPATVTVIPAQDIRARAANDFADLFVGAPGLNVSRLNARDISFDFRTAGGVLSNSQLVLVDGRSLNQEGLGNVFWDLFPVDFDDIAQVELIATPGSAVWGAGALSGVINVRTKAPKDDPGGVVSVGFGSLGVRRGRLRWAQVVDRLSYRASASYYEADAWERDTTLPDGSPLPSTAVFPNQGTKQTKGELRVDWEQRPGKVVSSHIGFADSSGIIHTQTGPNTWSDTGSYALYGGVAYKSDPLEASFYWHRLRGDTTSVLFGNTFFATTDAFTGEMVGRRAAGRRQALSYGGSVRATHFNLTLAPGDSLRSSVGGFIEDQIAVTPDLTWTVGARLDKFDTFGATLSPRTSLVYRPTRNQSLRVALNRAYRAPSLIETFAETDFVNVVPLFPGLPPVIFTTHIAGNRGVEPEVMRAFEAGVTTTLGPRASASATVYYNSVRDTIRFLQVASYGPTFPPQNWFLPLEFVPPLPRTMTFLNAGTVRDRGLELAGHAGWGRGVSTRASYWLQSDTKATKNDPQFPLQLNRPPTHQGSVGLVYAGRLWRGGADASYTGEAFWSDVLDARFWGVTKSFVMVNGRLGFTVPDTRAEISLSAINLFDRRIKQHAFGDIVRRQVTLDVRYAF